MKHQFIREIKISCAIIAATFLVFFGAFFWLQRDIAQRAEADAKFAVEIGSRSRAIAALAQNQQDAPIAAAYQKAIENLLPSKDGILNFHQWLDAQAGTWRISDRLSVGADVAPQGNQPGYYNISLDLGGNIQDIVGLLGTIERKSTEYLISIDSLEITSANGGANYTVSGQGKVFFK